MDPFNFVNPVFRGRSFPWAPRFSRTPSFVHPVCRGPLFALGRRGQSEVMAYVCIKDRQDECRRFRLKGGEQTDSKGFPNEGGFTKNVVHHRNGEHKRKGSTKKKGRSTKTRGPLNVGPKYGGPRTKMSKKNGVHGQLGPQKQNVDNGSSGGYGYLCAAWAYMIAVLNGCWWEALVFERYLKNEISGSRRSRAASTKTVARYGESFSFGVDRTLPTLPPPKTLTWTCWLKRSPVECVGALLHRRTMLLLERRRTIR